MEKFLVVSEHDKQVLKDQIRVVRNRQLNKLVDEPIRYAKSSDTFVVFLDFGNGPAGINLHDAAMQSDDEIHSDNLDIYKVIDAGGGVFNLTKIGSQQTVFNLNRYAVPRGYTLVTRDRFGNWFIIPKDSTVLVQLDSDLMNGQSISASIYDPILGTTTGETIPLYGSILTGTLPSGTIVIAQWIGRWEVVNANACEM